MEVIVIIPLALWRWGGGEVYLCGFVAEVDDQHLTRQRTGGHLQIGFVSTDGAATGGVEGSIAKHEVRLVALGPPDSCRFGDSFEHIRAVDRRNATEADAWQVSISAGILCVTLIILPIFTGERFLPPSSYLFLFTK